MFPGMSPRLHPVVNHKPNHTPTNAKIANRRT
jgi:hypothetical protein